MAEVCGLDRKIDNYKGTRRLMFYRWDLNCGMALFDMALRDERHYPDRLSCGFLALKRLGDRLHQEYNACMAMRIRPSSRRKTS